MSVKHTRRAIVLAASIALVGAALGAIPAVSAQAYAPTGGIMYQLGSDPCLKGRGNCAVYPKAVALPSGRLVAAFEKSTVVASSGGATGQTLPIYTSDDDGATWQARSQVAAPASLSSDPSVAKYTSNWTNPYLYVMPQTVGSLRAGTLVLASVVSGEDAYYMEHKAADPTWVPNNDGDRRDVAIALFSSTDEGVTWNFVNVIAAGGWQGGSAGAIGTNIAAANTAAEVDPVWEPYLLAYNGSLIAWYSDENDYTGVNTSTACPPSTPPTPRPPTRTGRSSRTARGTGSPPRRGARRSPTSPVSRRTTAGSRRSAAVVLAWPTWCRPSTANGCSATSTGAAAPTHATSWRPARSRSGQTAPRAGPAWTRSLSPRDPTRSRAVAAPY